MSIRSKAVQTTRGVYHSWSAGHAGISAVLAVSLAAGVASGLSFPGGVQLVLLAALTAVVGTPHGGLDHLVGRAVCRPIAGRWWPVVFSTCYLGLASVVLAGWVVAPLATALAFFLASAVHFGEGGRLPMAAVEGGMVIWIPFLARSGEASQLLSWVTPGHPSAIILDAAVVARPLLWGLALATAGRIAWLLWFGVLDRSPSRVIEAIRLAAFAGLFATVPVLVSFLAYFCGWHSTRELARLARWANPSRPVLGLSRVAWLSAPLTVMTVAATSLTAGFYSSGRAVEGVVVQAVFLGLSAVAIPHIVLHAIAGKLGVHPFAAGAGS